MMGVAVSRLPTAPIPMLGAFAAAPAALSENLAMPLAAMPIMPVALAAVPAMIGAPMATELASEAGFAGPLPAAGAQVADALNVPAEKSAPDLETDAARAGARFDGSGNAASVVSTSERPAVKAPTAPLGSGLKSATEERAQWLASVVGLLSDTRTGRRVLRDIDALAARNGRPTLLNVKAIGNDGEFRYDSGLIVMDVRYLKLDPSQSAPILAHELQHVLQRAMNLPTDALELEIESYTVENRVWRELGVEPDDGTLSRQVRRSIAKGPAVFAKWLGNQSIYDPDHMRSILI